MRRSGFIGVLVLASVAVVAGLIGYNAGLTSSAVASGATVVVTGGYPGFGTLFFLLFVGFLFFGVAGRKRAWMGHHGHGPWGGRGAFGPGGPGSAGGPGAGLGPMGNPSDPRRQWVAEMHRRLHEEEAKGAGAGSSQAGSAASTGPGPNPG